MAVPDLRRAALRLGGRRACSARSWREIVAEMGISKGSAQRAFCGLPKNVSMRILAKLTRESWWRAPPQKFLSILSSFRSEK